MVDSLSSGEEFEMSAAEILLEEQAAKEAETPSRIPRGAFGPAVPTPADGTLPPGTKSLSEIAKIGDVEIRVVLYGRQGKKLAPSKFLVPMADCLDRIELA